jgi:regulator of cell morphogenesis and NO signaling
MSITSATTLADLVADEPATIPILQRHDIAFCCAPPVALSEVCAQEHLDLETFLAELREAAAGFSESRDWQAAPLPELVTHIQTHYHQHLYAELPRLGAMLQRVVTRHGERLAETLGPLETAFEFLAADLTHHMQREDMVLFPAIIAADKGEPLRIPLADAIGVMERDHDRANEVIRQIRGITDGSHPPADACATFRGLYYGLADLEHRMRLHVHLENDILFPRALAISRGNASASSLEG